LTITSIIAAIIVGLMILGAILGPVLAHRRQKAQFHNQTYTGQDSTLPGMRDENKVRIGLGGQQPLVESLNLAPLSISKSGQYLTDRIDVQTKFYDGHGEAAAGTGHLLMEVIQLRERNVSTFQQRANNFLVNYPVGTTNYSASRKTAIGIVDHQPRDEDFRQAMINYRPLFDELLKKEMLP
jgi:hypothetical protein